MVPPAREQAQHPPQIGLVVGLGENAPPDRYRGVAGEDDLVLGARHRVRLVDCDAQHIVARQLGATDLFVDIGRGDSRGLGPDPPEQIEPTRRSGGEDEPHRPAAHLKR
jgi:hypothetical protein